MRIATVIFIILININVIHSGFLMNYETIKKYEKTPRHQRQNLENESILETKYDLVFNLYTERYSFKLCLFEDKNVVSNELSDNGIFKSLKIYKGIVCHEPAEIVMGAIINSIFHGSIYKNNSKIYYFEDIRKYSKDIDCIECHTIAYSSDDIDNSVLNSYNLSCGNEKKHNFKFDDISRISYRQIYDRKAQTQTNPYAKKYCALAVYIHYSYLEYFINIASAIAEIASHIASLNQALTKQISHNGDPLLLYQISLVSKVDKGNIYDGVVEDPNKLLPLVSETSSKNGYCSSGFYVSQNWHGVLGLGYVGNSQGSGICGRSAAYVITQKVDNEIMPSAVHKVTTVHEIGHNLGSSHDPADQCPNGGCFDVSRKAECSPPGNFYLMSIYSTSGRDSNNLFYSPCSVEAIAAIVTSPERRTCLKEAVSNLCGNGIIESGEECDSGFIEDECCGSSSSPNPCKVLKGVCSPSQGSCCDGQTCAYKSNQTVCGIITDCLIKSECSGISAICPQEKFEPNDKVCNNGGALCVDGACTGSICKNFGKEECKCNGESSCLVCCTDAANNGTACLPYMFSPDDKTKTLPVGTTCTNGTINGICTASFQCTGTTSASPIFDLLKLFLTGDVLTLLASLFTTYIEFFIIGISAFFLIFSNLARIANVDGKKKLKNYTNSKDNVQNPLLVLNLEQKLKEKGLQDKDKNNRSYKHSPESIILNPNDDKLKNYNKPSSTPYENTPYYQPFNDKNNKIGISSNDKIMPNEYSVGSNKENSKNPNNKRYNDSLLGLPNNDNTQNRIRADMESNSNFPNSSKIKKSKDINQNPNFQGMRAMDLF